MTRFSVFMVHFYAFLTMAVNADPSSGLSSFAGGPEWLWLVAAALTLGNGFIVLVEGTR